MAKVAEKVEKKRRNPAIFEDSAPVTPRQRLQAEAMGRKKRKVKVPVVSKRQRRVAQGRSGY